LALNPKETHTMSKDLKSAAMMALAVAAGLMLESYLTRRTAVGQIVG